MPKIGLPFVGLFLVSLWLSDNAFAMETIYCPSTGRFAHTGITKQGLIEQCGQPQQKHEGKENVTEQQPIELWHYHLRIRHDDVTVVLTIKNNTVSAIGVDSQALESTDICRNDRLIRIGDSVNKARSVCGRPRFISRSTVTEEKGKRDAAVWIYKFNEYQPSVYFKFENGILTSIIQE